MVHSDVCGKINSKSLSGAEYFLTFVDDHTRYTWVYALKQKKQVFEKFLEWKALVENSTGQKLKILRTDNGGEFTSTQFENFLKSEGVRHERTIVKTPEQNGVAERINRTLIETVRSMLADSKLPPKFWAEALATATYLHNRSPTKAVTGATPHEAWMGEKPRVDHLKAFGCAAYAHIPKDERQKLDPKARKCIFLGYGCETKGYRLYDPRRERILFSRDVLFNESDHGIEGSIHAVQEKKQCVEVRMLDEEEETEREEPADEEETEHEEPADEEAADEENEEAPPAPPARRSLRQKQQPDYYGEWASVAANEPTTVTEALCSPEKKEWIAAMEREMQSLSENDVWELVELPKDRKMVGSKWVFKRKFGADGSIERHKARLIAQGFTQKFGLDYDETFSPVIRFESLRTLFALAAHNSLKLQQLDVTTAFLNGELEEEVYMRQPEGFVTKGQEHLVCKLKKSIYGLKQSPRCWNATLHCHLEEMGFEQTTSDPCLYTSKEEEMFIIGVYVDDIVLGGKRNSRISEVKTALSMRLVMKDMGELHYFLGMSVNQDQKTGRVWIGQPAYAEKLLEKFGMGSANPVSTPVEYGLKLAKASEEDSKSDCVDQGLYQSAVGGLLYLATSTRPDIAYGVNNVAKFCSQPTKQHWVAVKRILRYLKGTVNLGLLYRKGSSSSCVGFSDADWAGDINDRRSTSGYLFQLSGAAVSWRSKKQSCVALSTAEAEYMALASTAQEAIWMRRLTSDLKNGPTTGTVIFEDNRSAICMAQNPQFHGRTKHIAIKFHFIREQVKNGNIELKHCETKEMVADMLTKGLYRDQFTKLRKMAGMEEMPKHDV